MAATIYPLSRTMGGLEGVAVSVLLSLAAATVVYVASLRATFPHSPFPALFPFP